MTETSHPASPARYVIVGGVAGGMSTATRLRRLDETAEITVVERSGHVSFANCGLPYYVGGVIEERSSLLLQTPESLAARFGIRVLVDTEVTGIDAAARTVTLRTAAGAETELGYDHLVLSPGARPVFPPIPGIERALPLRDVEDTDRMAAAVADARTAVVVGGGFIGVEVAENLVHRGLQVTLVEATSQVMAPLDPEMVAPVRERLRERGVDLRLGAAGRPHRIIHTHPASHAGYYPGAATMALKLLVDPETDAILGAQGVGEEGVDKRIDVIATAIAGGLTASDLADLELAYAPAFGSAKDAVNMLGYVDQNVAGGVSETVQWHELEDALADGASVVDVRSPGEFAAGAIPGAVNIPVDELRDRLADVPEGELVVHCAVGLRGHIAARILAAHGRRARNLDGGYRTWTAGTASGAAQTA